MLTLTSPVDTALHKIPALVKLAALIAVTTIVFGITDLWLLVAVLALAMGLYLTGGPHLLTYGVRLLRPLWPFAAMIVLWHLWRDTPALGAAVLLRMAIAVMLANLVTMTTRLDDMIALITRAAAPLRHIGLPPRRLALALALAIRFVPEMLQSATRLSLAWRARSARRAAHRLIAPLTLAAIDTADHVAEALRARGGVG